MKTTTHKAIYLHTAHINAPANEKIRIIIKQKQISTTGKNNAPQSMQSTSKLETRQL